MKTEEDIATMAMALITLDKSLPPGIEQLAKARLQGMQLILAWTLGSPLPGDYPDWFDGVLQAWREHQQEVPAFNE